MDQGREVLNDAFERPGRQGRWQMRERWRGEAVGGGNGGRDGRAVVSRFGDEAELPVVLELGATHEEVVVARPEGHRNAGAGERGRGRLGAAEHADAVEPDADPVVVREVEGRGAAGGTATGEGVGLDKGRRADGPAQVQQPEGGEVAGFGVMPSDAVAGAERVGKQGGIGLGELLQAGGRVETEGLREQPAIGAEDPDRAHLLKAVPGLHAAVELRQAAGQAGMGTHHEAVTLEQRAAGRQG